MRRFANRIRAAIGAATLLACASPLAAQGPGGPPGRGMMRGPGMRGAGGVAARLAANPERLGLNDQQTGRLRRVAQWLEQSDSSVRGQMRAALGGKRLMDLSAEQRYQYMKQIEPLAEQLRANRRSQLDSLHAILTTEQFQRLADRAMTMRAWGRGFGRGRMGFRAGPPMPRRGFWGGGPPD